MTLRRDKVTRIYSADIRDRQVARVHLSLKTTDKRDALQRYAALEAFIREGDPTLVADLRARRLNIEAVARCYRDRKPFSELRSRQSWPTLCDAIEQYVTHLENHPNRAPNTARGAKYDLSGACEFFGDSRTVDSIQHGDIQLYRDWLTTTKSLKSSTLYGRVQRLRALFNWLKRREELAARDAKRPPDEIHNPVIAEEMPARPFGRVRFLSAEEAECLMAATPERYQLFVGLGLLAGLRVDEARTLRRADIDDVAETVVIQPKTLPTGQPWRPKTRGSHRDVPIAEQLRALIDRHLKYYAGRVWVFPAPAHGFGAKLTREIPVSSDALQRMLKRVVTDAEMSYGHESPDGVTFHTLRHTFASWLVMSGVGLFTVSRLLGHGTTAEVERTYAHLAPEHRRAAILKLGATLSKAFGPKLVTDATR